MDLDIHPYARIFPAMTKHELDELRKDVGLHGIYHPLSLHKGLILDGRHRYKVACELGVSFKTVKFEGTDAEAFAYVISSNLHRRHLTTRQRAALAAEFANFVRGSNGSMKRANGTAHPGMSNAMAAKAFNVSEASVKNAKATMHKDPEAHEAAKQGTKPKPKPKPKPSVKPEPEAKPKAEPKAEPPEPEAKPSVKPEPKAEPPHSLDEKLQRVLWPLPKATQELVYEAISVRDKKIEDLEKAKARLEREKQDWLSRRRKGNNIPITEADLNFLIQSLHPDREMDKAKQTRCFQIIRPLKEIIKK